MTIGELGVDLVFNPQVTKLRDFIHDLGDLNISALIGGGALGLMVDKIKDIMDVADGAARSLNIFHSLTGLSTQDLQKWDQAATEVGISTGEMAGVVDGLQNRIETLKMTGEGASLFSALGIDPTQMTDTFSSLKLILNSIKDMDVAKQKFILGKFNLPENLVQLIPNLDRINSLTTNSDEDLKSMSGYMRLMADLSADWKKLMTEIGAILENAFIRDLLYGLDLIVKFVSHWQVLIPILTTIAFIMGQIAATSIIASLANPATAPFAIGALAVGGTLLGASLLGALTRPHDEDNGTNMNMTNNVTIHGDSAENNFKAFDNWQKQQLNNANDQQPFYSV